jgi:hypothetical protein
MKLATLAGAALLLTAGYAFGRVLLAVNRGCSTDCEPKHIQPSDHHYGQCHMPVHLG